MIVIDLIYNLTLLIAISILAGFIDKRWGRETINGQLLQGLLFGITAIIGMMQPFVMTEGIIFDGRSVILSICALFFGPISALIAAIMATFYRIYLGGGGVIMGVSVISASTIIGLIYYNLRKTRFIPINSLNLFILGIVVHLVMILLMFTLPTKLQFITLKIISFTVIIAYPLATVLMGKILKDQEDNENLIKEIKESESKYRLLIENQSDLIVKLDNSGKFLYVSQSYCQFFGQKEIELIGKVFLPLLQDEDKDLTTKTLNSLKISPYKSSIEQRALSVNGWRWISWAYQAVTDNNGEIKEIVAVGRDITERKDYENRIQELNEELEERVKKRTKQLEDINNELEAFTYSVSHDLRSPLRAIDGFSKIIIEDFANDLNAESLRLFKVIRESTSKMETLINDLLILSRTNKISLRNNTINISELAKNIYEEISDENTKMSFIFIVNESPIAIADSNLIKQVLTNLISNAIKYSMPKAEKYIEFGGYVNSNENIYYIKDHGVGYNEQYADKLFCAFQRLHNSKDFSGTGVGLAIVKRIITRHGGRVWAEGKVNEGACFWFSLPAKTE